MRKGVYEDSDTWKFSKTADYGSGVDPEWERKCRESFESVNALFASLMKSPDDWKLVNHFRGELNVYLDLKGNPKFKEPPVVVNFMTGDVVFHLTRVASELINWVDSGGCLFSDENSHRARINNFVDALAGSLGLERCPAGEGEGSK